MSFALYVEQNCTLIANSIRLHMKGCYIDRANKVCSLQEWVTCQFPFIEMLFDLLFGLQPLQLQDALKCQQCHKQFRSKAGLNYHTMAEHTTKVHHARVHM